MCLYLKSRLFRFFSLRSKKTPCASIRWGKHFPSEQFALEQVVADAVREFCYRIRRFFDAVRRFSI